MISETADLTTHPVMLSPAHSNSSNLDIFLAAANDDELPLPSRHRPIFDDPIAAFGRIRPRRNSLASQSTATSPAMSATESPESGKQEGGWDDSSMSAMNVEPIDSVEIYPTRQRMKRMAEFVVRRKSSDDYLVHDMNTRQDWTVPSLKPLSDPY